MEQPKLNIDLKSTTPIKSEDGNYIFTEGVILRKVSKFITGQSIDSILPIPVFYDIKTGKILLDMIPKEIRDEYDSNKPTEVIEDKILPSSGLRSV